MLFVLYIFLYFRKSEQFTRAAECFKSSLKYNPYLWSSFENLCQLGMTLVWVTSDSDSCIGQYVVLSQNIQKLTRNI